LDSSPFALLNSHDPHGVGIGGDVDVPVGIFGRVSANRRNALILFSPSSSKFFYHFENLDQGGFLRGMRLKRPRDL